jgi:hypothetical protein
MYLVAIQLSYEKLKKTRYYLLSHTNKCTNYIIYYLKSVLIIDIKTLS